MKPGETCKPVLSMKDTTEVCCDIHTGWAEAALILREKLLKEMRNKCEQLEREIKKFEEQKGKIDIPIGEFYESVKLKPTKWITRPDFMDDVINICPTCGKEFSMPDGTSVAHYYKYCPFCGDKMEE